MKQNIILNNPQKSKLLEYLKNNVKPTQSVRKLYIYNVTNLAINIKSDEPEVFIYKVMEKLAP